MPKGKGLRAGSMWQLSLMEATVGVKIGTHPQQKFTGKITQVVRKQDGKLQLSRKGLPPLIVDLLTGLVLPDQPLTPPESHQT